MEELDPHPLLLPPALISVSAAVMAAKVLFICDPGVIILHTVQGHLGKGAFSKVGPSPTLENTSLSVWQQEARQTENHSNGNSLKSKITQQSSQTLQA